VWSSRANAEHWIARLGASGTLSAYVLNESAYDSNVTAGRLKADGPERRTPEFIREFTTPIDHSHYTDGRRGS
jgi:hypothetical protein